MPELSQEIRNTIMPIKSIIKGYEPGANLTLLNTLYIKPSRDSNNKVTDDYLYIIYRDNDTGEKKLETIKHPSFRYYIANPGVNLDHNVLYIAANKVHPITCKYKDLRISLAKETNNYDWFMDAIKSGNYKQTDKLFEIPTVFEADVDIEDFYRFEFDRLYKNEPFKLTKMYLDIETDIFGITNDFPMPGQCPINAVSLVDETVNTVYTLLLENDNNKQIAEFKNEHGIPDQIKQFVQNHVGGWKAEYRFGLADFKYKVIFFRDEMELIKAIFGIINTNKPDMVLAWNASFDIPYIIARIAKLGYDPATIISHPDFELPYAYYYIDQHAEKFEERNDLAQIASYSVYLDQLILFASRRKGQRMVGSYKLDAIGEYSAGVKKLDYSKLTRNLAMLPRLNYKMFVFYNICDTIVQKCIESKCADVDFVFAKSLGVNTRYAKIHRQTQYLKNRAIKDFWSYGYILGCNANKHNSKTPFAGAFVADPVLVSDKPKIHINGKAINLLNNCIDLDYSSLYPSIIAQNNIGQEQMYGRIILPERLDKDENRFANDYFDRTVSFIEDMLSTNYIAFCHRYLRMPSYQEMYELVALYFRTVHNPNRGLRIHDAITGKRFLYHIINTNEKRRLYRLVDKEKKKKLMIITDRMPKLELQKKVN